MRLSAFPPSLVPPELLSGLLNLGLKTDTDLLLLDVRDIMKCLPPGCISFQELRQIHETIAARASAHGLSALDIRSNCLSNHHKYGLSSGINELDALMNGFGGGRVLEVSGEKGTGKSTLALHLVLRLLTANSTSSALWIDTAGDFSGARLASMLPAYHGTDRTSVLDRFDVSLAFDIETAQQILETLNASLSQRNDAEDGPRVQALVIDSLTPLLGPHLSATSSQGHAIMVVFMRLLRTLSRVHSLAILVLNGATTIRGPGDHIRSITNPASAFAWTTRKPALGPSLGFLSDGTLWMSRWGGKPSEGDTMGIGEVPHGEDNVLVVEVFTSRFTRSHTWCAFKIRRSDGVPTSIGIGEEPGCNDLTVTNTLGSMVSEVSALKPLLRLGAHPGFHCLSCHGLDAHYLCFPIGALYECRHMGRLKWRQA